jgi:hypothetical protein
MSKEEAKEEAKGNPIVMQAAPRANIQVALRGYPEGEAIQ